jgi:hypothetical protein
MAHVPHSFWKIFPLFKQIFGYLQVFATFFTINCLGAPDPTGLAEAALKAGKNGRFKCHTPCKFGSVGDHPLLNCLG